MLANCRMVVVGWARVDTHDYSRSTISSDSFPTTPLPVTRHVAQCKSNPGGPIKLQNSTECAVKTPLRSPSSQIQRPTNISQVRTCDHSSETKFGYCIMPRNAFCGSPEGSKTPENSARGAVAPGWTIDADTIKKWTKQHRITTSAYTKNEL